MFYVRPFLFLLRKMDYVRPYRKNEKGKQEVGEKCKYVETELPGQLLPISRTRTAQPVCSSPNPELELVHPNLEGDRSTYTRIPWPELFDQLPLT